jgi:hypothetical protein
MPVKGVDDSAAHLLRAALRALHVRAGQPSTRVIARGIGSISHTTVSQTLRGDRVPSWPLLSKIVLGLGGDEDEFRDLWAATRHAGAPTEGLPAPAESSTSDVSVFVSYARVDDEAAYSRVTKFACSIKRLHESMTGEQVRLYMDTDSSAEGDIWIDRIRLGMSSSAILLAFISPAYLRSARCREEYRELTSFVCASSNSRLIVPLLFSERERIEKYFGDQAIWREIQALDPVPVEQVRCEEPGSYKWLRKTQEVVNRIESVLANVARPTSSKAVEAVESAERDAVNSTSFFEILADAQDAAPKMTAHIEALSALLVRLRNEASKATPGMSRATTAKRKLATSRHLAQVITPISTALAEQANGLRLGINKWDRAVKIITARIRELREQIHANEVMAAFEAINQMVTKRVESLSSLDLLGGEIGSVKGFSHELDVPLRVIEEALRDVAEARGIFKGWSEGMAVVEITLHDELLITQ